MQPRIEVLFEHHHDEWPNHTEGPFIWIEQIGANMFGCRIEDHEAEEIAGVNIDGSWDAGPFEDDGNGQRKRRGYSRWTIGVYKELEGQELADALAHAIASFPDDDFFAAGSNGVKKATFDQQLVTLTFGDDTVQHYSVEDARNILTEYQYKSKVQNQPKDTKRCRDCKKRKPLTEFTFDGTPGYHEICSDCNRVAEETFETNEREEAWKRARAIDPDWPAGENGYPAANP